MGSGCFSIVFVFFCFDDDYWFDYVDVFGYFYEVFFVFNVFYVDEDCFCVFIFFEVFEEVSVVDVVFVFNVNYSGEIDFFKDCLVYKGYFKGIVWLMRVSGFGRMLVGLKVVLSFLGV